MRVQIKLPWSDGFVNAGEFLFRLLVTQRIDPRRSFDANKGGGALHCVLVSPKTPNLSGKSSWEAYQAQFEHLATATHWPDTVKALQPALPLTEDASTRLLLLSPDERGDYTMLVGTLHKRFGESNLKDSVLRIQPRC